MSPSASDANDVPSRSTAPGKWAPTPVTTQPRNAAMATRPCLISAARNQSSVLSLTLSAMPMGSK